MRLLSLACVCLAGTASSCVSERYVPVSPLYDSCFSVEDCDAPADTCFEIVEDGRLLVGQMCTNYCDLRAANPDASCFDGGVCYAIEPSAWGVCFARCTDVDGAPNDRLCSLRFECIEALRDDGFSDFICWPR